MESQVKQLKINARNIESFLSKSNKTLRKHKQDQKKFNIRQTTIQKQKVKESKIESVRSPIRKSSNAISYYTVALLPINVLASSTCKY